MSECYKEINLIADKDFLINNSKYLLAHNWRCNCQCSGKVTNLLGGERIWTRVRFECGEVIKINSCCLDEII